MKWKEERGAMSIVEATFVFPIMFFVLFFLIYMGNMFYMRSQVDSIVTSTAVKAAAYCADPLLYHVKDSGGAIPTEIDNIEPYHNLLKNGALSNGELESMKTELRTKLQKLGVGFFAGMGLKQVTINRFQKENSLLSNTFTVDVTYRIQFPIRFLGDGNPTILKIQSKSVVPVTDTPEFILNVDMAMDYYESSGLKEKLAEMRSKVSAFFK